MFVFLLLCELMDGFIQEIGLQHAIAPLWLEKEQQWQVQGEGADQQAGGMEEPFDIMEGDVATSTPPSTHIEI